jgi:hypothetical protein
MSGPAGLELSYKISDAWEAGTGGGMRMSRFRLSSVGSTPNGIGENEGWNAYARLSKKFGSGLIFHIYGGMITEGKMTLQDSSGNDISSISYGTTPFMGCSLQAGF